MDNENREPVIINNERRSSPLGWILALVVLAVLALLFFWTNGFGLLGGTEESTTTDDSNSINVDTPDSVNVEPANP